jgi:Uri superfamily endonuclease
LIVCIWVRMLLVLIRLISLLRYSWAVPVKGTYCLCIENHQKISIQIGALGEIEFNRGYYVYVGSALNSLIPRLERHLKTSRGEHHVTHWHIDYLLRETTVEIKSIHTIETDEHLECDIAEKISMYGEAIPRFGCSDCSCQSHLFHVDGFEFVKKIGLKKWF